MGNKLPYDVINSGLKTIAGKLDAELPTKKYSNVKDEIAGAVNAIAGADIGGGGGGNAMVVNITFVEGQPTSDKTIAEILQHHASGGIVYCRYTPSGSNTYTTSTSFIDGTAARFVFADFSPNSGMQGTWSMMCVTISNSDAVDYYSKYLS